MAFQHPSYDKNIKTWQSQAFSHVALAGRPVYSVPMTSCCWNIRNVPEEGHNNDCFVAYGPQYRDATMAVTFTDGQTVIYKNVRVCINRVDNDGIRVDGTTLRFETSDGTCFTLLGVRQYVYTIDGDL